MGCGVGWLCCCRWWSGVSAVRVGVGSMIAVVWRGILFVLFSGLPWEAVPAELAVSGVTCWRRLGEWQRAGVGSGCRSCCCAELEQAGLVDERRYIVDASIVPAKERGRRDGAQPGGSGPHRVQAGMLDLRRGRPAAGAAAFERGQRQRLRDVVAAARPGRPSGRAGLGWCSPTAATTARAVREGVSARGHEPRIAKRNPPGGGKRRDLARARAQRDRTHLRLAVLDASALHPLGATRRPSPRLPHPRAARSSAGADSNTHCERSYWYRRYQEPGFAQGRVESPRPRARSVPVRSSPVLLFFALEADPVARLVGLCAECGRHHRHSTCGADRWPLVIHTQSIGVAVDSWTGIDDGGL